MNWPTRHALPDDRRDILGVVRDAFTGPDHDGGEEVDIVAATWDRSASVVDEVAVVEGVIAGHVLAGLGDLGGRAIPGIAPLCVSPKAQGNGIGTALMQEALRQADAQGWPLVVVLGNPSYYGRFGFEPAGPLGILYGPGGPDSPYFQVRRLSSFEPVQGEYRYCWELEAQP
jgi:predicted N-acetyltransferase YhbS